MLALARAQGVAIGALGHKESYVIVPSGEIKISGIGLYRSTGMVSHANDLYDLRNFFWLTPFFNASLSEEWIGFDLVGTPGLGYPLLLCQGKSLIVIHNYVLTAERPDPCSPEPYSPGKRP